MATPHPGGRCATLLLLPFQLSILLLLHVLYGVYRAVNHVRHRPKASAPRRQRDASTSIVVDEEDLSRWTARKLPSHLAVAFTPSPDNGLLRRLQSSTSHRKQQLVEDVEVLVQWCCQAGIERLSVYDAQGLLTSLAERMEVSLAAQGTGLTISQPLSRKRFTVTNNTKGASCEIRFLGPQDGRPFLGQLTQELHLGVARGHLRPEDIDVPFVQEKMSSAGYDEPQLLVVLGGYLLQLRDYPPWSIRLTEIYHEPSLQLLGPSRLSYATFRKALDSFAQCEMRFGR